MANTARLNLDLIAANQAQKHVPANETFARLDTLVQMSVLDKDLTAPPGSPSEGDCYIVAAGATGAWAGNDKAIARHEDGAWRFLTVPTGSLVWVQDEEAIYVYSGSGGANWGPALGTAAYANIGTSGDAVPTLNAAQTWSAAQMFSGTATPVALSYSDDGAGANPFLNIIRESASPAANDFLGGIGFRGKNSAGSTVTYAALTSRIIDPTSGSHDGAFYFHTTVNSSSTTTMHLRAGLVVGNPTGGDQGVGTLNASALYDDGVAVCPALRREFLESGTVDLDFWDATVPDIEIPEVVEDVPVFEDVTEDARVLEDKGDCVICRTERRTVRREKVDIVPVVDERGAPMRDGAGQPVTIERPVMETRVTPAQTITRRHEIAHLFKRMLDDGFDPREPRQYIARLTADQALPGMPTVEAFTRGPKISLTEKFERLWLALEMLALVVISQEKRITVLEDRLRK